jgi:ribonuclease BN (tRNA processing enzyme)
MWEPIVKLYILGCGDAFGSGGRNQSGYLIEADQHLFLLDCGPTTLPAMKRAGIDPRRLEAIFVSHLHGDHFGGIPFFFLEYLYQNPREKPLHIAGPPGAEERIRELFRLMYDSGAGSKDLPPTEFYTLTPEQAVNIQGVHILPFRVPHQVHEVSLGLRVTCDRKQVLFSGDSAWSEIFITHARGVDLFLCECSFYNQETSNHVNYLTLRKNLSRLECKKLLLTHLGAEMLGRKKELPVMLAEDGMVIEI